MKNERTEYDVTISTCIDHGTVAEDGYMYSRPLELACLDDIALFNRLAAFGTGIQHIPHGVGTIAYLDKVIPSDWILAFSLRLTEAIRGETVWTEEAFQAQKEAQGFYEASMIERSYDNGRPPVAEPSEQYDRPEGIVG